MILKNIHSSSNKYKNNNIKKTAAPICSFIELASSDSETEKSTNNKQRIKRNFV